MQKPSIGAPALLQRKSRFAYVASRAGANLRKACEEGSRGARLRATACFCSFCSFCGRGACRIQEPVHSLRTRPHVGCKPSNDPSSPLALRFVFDKLTSTQHTWKMQRFAPLFATLVATLQRLARFGTIDVVSHCTSNFPVAFTVLSFHYLHS